MKTVSIGELADGASTWNPQRRPDTVLEYVDLSGVDNEEKAVTSSARMTGAAAPSRARQIVAAGDVLVSTVRPNLNAVAVVPRHLDGATVSTGFCVLRPGSRVDGRFLFHWVRTPGFVADMVRKATGASYPAVSDRIVRESLVPRLPLEEQRRIAAILDHAEALRAKRRQVLAHLDTLKQSVFHQMFGNTSATVPLKNLVAGFRYGTSNKSSGNGYPALRIPNVIGGRLKLAEVKTVAVEQAEFERLRLRDGDLLFVRSNGNPQNVGRCSSFERSMVEDAGFDAEAWIYASYLIRARPLDDQDSQFLSAFLSSAAARRQLQSKAKTSAGQFNINIEGLGSVDVPSIPYDRQREFTSRIFDVDQQIASVHAALSTNEILFSSLQSRAFSGQL